ncbi:MAG: hypothetical protein KAT46_00105 [Deltaproteobacteria bacterium]|nr:hypothetical protein [Deltaproteobacteria bacterium]
MCDPLKIFKAVLSEFNNHSKWKSALFEKVKLIPNTKVGSVGQNFIERLCVELDIPCSFPVNEKGKRLTQNSWDIKILDIEFELKTATEDTNKHFQFNHIRYHRQYEGLLCLGVSPADLYFGIWSKADVTTGKAGNLVSMEKGANASYKLTKKPDQLNPIDSFQTEIQKFSDNFG